MNMVLRSRIPVPASALSLSPGPSAAFAATFGVGLSIYATGPRHLPCPPTGPIVMPADLSQIIEALSGLDGRPAPAPTTWTPAKARKPHLLFQVLKMTFSLYTHHSRRTFSRLV